MRAVTNSNMVRHHLTREQVVYGGITDNKNKHKNYDTDERNLLKIETDGKRSFGCF